MQMATYSAMAYAVICTRMRMGSTTLATQTRTMATSFAGARRWAVLIWSWPCRASAVPVPGNTFPCGPRAQL